LSSYAQNHIHLVFSTKGRLKLISKDIQTRLWGYIAAICKKNAMTVFAVGGIADHIHILFRLPPSLSLVRAGDAYQIRKMDEGDEKDLCLAEGLRRVQRELIECVHGDSVHRPAGSPPQEEIV
jgi:hypothetical protein